MLFHDSAVSDSRLSGRPGLRDELSNLQGHVLAPSAMASNVVLNMLCSEHALHDLSVYNRPECWKPASDPCVVKMLAGWVLDAFTLPG